MITAENVQWKKAILLVMAVEEAAELIAVDRVVGCVEVQHDLLRWHGVGLKEQLDEEPFDSSCAADDLSCTGYPRRPRRGSVRAD